MLDSLAYQMTSSMVVVAAKKEDTSGDGWTLEKMITNAGTYATVVGGAIITLIGIVLIIYASMKVFKAITGQQQGGGEWVKAILALLVGGAFSIGGYSLLSKMASGGQKTVEKLGTGSAIHETFAPYADFGRTFLQMFY